MSRSVRTSTVAFIAVLMCAAPTDRRVLARQAGGTGVVAGQVIDATTKRPVGGAVVTLTISGAPAAPGPPPPSPSRNSRSVAVANADGRFVFRDLPAASYSLEASLDGYAPGAFGRRRPGGSGRPFAIADAARVTDAVIPIWRLGAISGLVRDDRGEPVVGVAVWALRRTMTNGRFELSFADGGGEVTDDRGHYRASGLPPGSYVVVVRFSTQSASVPTVDNYQAAVTSGTSAAMRRDWIETGGIFEGRPGLVVDGWQVSVSNSMPPPFPGPNGTLLVHPTAFHANATAPADATLLTLAAGDDRTGVDLTLPLVPSVRVSGVLTGPDGPVANSGVRLMPASAGDLAFEVPAAYAITDATGKFTFLGVAPGAYVIRAYRVSMGRMNVPAPPAAGARAGTREAMEAPAGPPSPSLVAEAAVAVGSTNINGIALSFQPGARLSGRVVYDGATPPVAASRVRQTVAIRPLSGTVAGTDAFLDADGRFTTQGYPPGRYFVFNVTPPAPEWTLASVRIGGVDVAGQSFAIGTTDVNDVEVTFTDKVTTLSGAVRGADGGADNEATVVVFPDDVSAWLASGMSSRRVAMAPTSVSGGYQIRVPLPGNYRVVAVPPDVEPIVDREFVARFAATAQRVTLALGDAKTQALTVRRAQ